MVSIEREEGVPTLNKSKAIFQSHLKGNSGFTKVLPVKNQNKKTADEITIERTLAWAAPATPRFKT